MSDGHDTTHHVNESADKITLTTKVKRGTDTRDQDTVKVKIKGDDPIETVGRLNDVLQEMRTVDTYDKIRESRAGGADD